MAKKILIGAALFFTALFIYVGFKSGDYSISRQVVVNAKAEAVFPHINNSKKLDAWMPWKESDPKVEMKFAGPADGVGATTRWDSAGRMGTGEAVIIASIPDSLVKTQITYTKPMTMSQISTMSVSPVKEGTQVTWSVAGKNNFIGRLFCLFTNMDKEVGPHFEKGLNSLKNIVEQKK